MSHAMMGMALRRFFSLLLVVAISGCSTGTEPTSTTATTTQPPPREPLRVFPGPDFGIVGFVSIPNDQHTRLVAYGNNAAYQPFVGVLDASNGTWTSVQLSPLPEHFRVIYGAPIGPSGLGVIFEVRDSSFRSFRSGWAMFDGKAWHVDEPTPRWLMRTPGGVVQVETRTYALLLGDSINRAAEVWYLDGNEWRQDVVGLGIPGAHTGALSGNRTHLQVCTWDEEGNVVLLSKTPGATTYAREVVWQAGAAASVVGGVLVCTIASSNEGRPLLAWHEYPIRLNTAASRDELLAARFLGENWLVEQIGNKSGDPWALVGVKDGGGFLFAGPTQTTSSQLWRLLSGRWAACENGMEAPDEALVVNQMLVQWGPSAAAFVNRVHPGGNVTVQPLSPSSVSCV